MVRWRPLVVCGAMAALVVCPSAIGAPTPNVPVSERATFDVIVEGTGEASRDVTIDGQIGPCTVSARTVSTESWEYGRGRGLRVEFVRIGSGRVGAVVMRRVGRPLFAPVAFNVRATVTSTASGQAERLGPTGICISTVETVGDEPLCGRRPGREDYALAYVNGRLSLGLSGDALPPLPSARLCGANSIESASGPPPDGFHSPVELRARPLPASRIFGSVRRFAVPLTARDAVSRQDSPIPGLSGSALNRASHTAVVRFIRVS